MKTSKDCHCEACNPCCCDDQPTDPQVTHLLSELRIVGRGLQRFAARATEKPPVRQEKEKRTVTAAERRAAEELAAGEKAPQKPRS